jgi:hypothetical protein
MKPASLLRWYPRAWRERYGEELLALIQDTLDEGRPTWRLRLGVAWGGLRERAHQARHAGRAAVKRLARLDRWWSLFVAGLVLATLPEAVTESSPPARGWQAPAVDGMLAAVVLTGALVLASGLMALPALVRFLQAGGRPKIRRQVMWAAGATVVSGGALAGLSFALGSASFAQLNASWAYSAGLLAGGLAVAVAIGLWASAAVATARHLTLAPRVRAAQLVLGAITAVTVTVMFVTLVLWWSASQSSVALLVMALVNLALWSVVAPAKIGRAVRKGRRLRAAASGATIVNPSVRRTHGRHQA